MTSQVGSVARVPRLCLAVQPDPPVPARSRSADGLQRAHHGPRPEDRPATDRGRGDHRRLRQALGLGALGRGPLGAQPARGRQRDHHCAWPEGGRQRHRAGPSPARSPSSATCLVRSREASRSAPRSSGSSTASTSAVRWRRPRADASSSSTRRAEADTETGPEEGPAVSWVTMVGDTGLPPARVTSRSMPPRLPACLSVSTGVGAQLRRHKLTGGR